MLKPHKPHKPASKKHQKSPELDQTQLALEVSGGAIRGWSETCKAAKVSLGKSWCQE